VKGSTIGMLVGAGAGIVGVGLISSALADIQAAHKTVPATPTALAATIPPSAKIKELSGGALLLGGIGLLLGSVVAKLSGAPTVHHALHAGEEEQDDEIDEDAAEERSSDIQSLLFRKSDGWTVKKAKAWAKSHDHRVGDVDVTDEMIHLRQYDPDKFQRFATKSFGRGISARIGFR